MDNRQSLVCFGEILWDLLPTGPLPGGAPMNVAYHLHTLGLKPQLVTRLGSDQRGTELISILQSKKIDTGFVQVDDAVATGIVHAKANEAGDMLYDIVSPAAWDGIRIDDALLALVAGADYFIYGSLSARSAVSRATLMQLLVVAREKVLDINLRAPHYSKELLGLLMAQANILKLNEEELELISSWYHGDKDLKTQVDYLVKRFGLSSVLVTRGAAGAIVFYKGQWAEHPGYKVKVADTVGSGDSFLAGFLRSVINGSSVEDALRFSCGLGSFVATRSGAWPHYQPGEIDEFIKER